MSTDSTTARRRGRTAKALESDRFALILILVFLLLALGTLFLWATQTYPTVQEARDLATKKQDPLEVLTALRDDWKSTVTTFSAITAVPGFGVLSALVGYKAGQKHG